MPARRILIPKKRLQKMYFEDRMSMSKIAIAFNCDHVTIVNRFKEFGWVSRGPRGTRKAIDIKKDYLSHLYVTKRLSMQKIAKRMNCSKGGIERKIKLFGIRTRGNNTRVHWKYPVKKDFNGNLLDKSYMIGFRLGDLNATETSQLVVLRCSTTKIAQIELIDNLFNKYGGVKTSLAKRGTFEIYCYLNKTFGFLTSNKKNIPIWIKKNKSYFFGFFAGYMDAEGYIDVKRKGFQLQSQDITIIWNSYKLLNQFGIKCNSPILSKKAGCVDKRGIKNNKDCWRISIYKRSDVINLTRILLLYSKHEDKIENLQAIVKKLHHTRHTTGGIC